jgi:hypothetical protein
MEVSGIRLQEFRLWMVLQHIAHPESHSRATESYTQFHRAVQGFRQQEVAMDQPRIQNRNRDIDRAKGDQPTNLFRVLLRN